MAAKPVLYSAGYSPPVRTVWMTAKLIGLELDNVSVDLLKGEHMSEEYLKKNPGHTIPTLYDDGEYIWESAAICTYLIGKYGPKDCPLYPTDLLKRARIDQRLYYNAAILFPRLRDGSVAVLFDGKPEIPDSIVNGALVAVDLLVAYLDNDFLVGNSLTLADLAVATTITNVCIYYELDRTKYARVFRWLDRIVEVFPEFTDLNQKYIDEFTVFYNDKLALNKANVQ